MMILLYLKKVKLKQGRNQILKNNILEYCRFFDCNASMIIRTNIS